jgi:hypothetical protein
MIRLLENYILLVMWYESATGGWGSFYAHTI